MRIDTRKSDDIFIITPLDNRIDASVAPDFKGHMINWIQEGNRRILLDLYHVEFIDSSGLSVLVSTLKALGTEGEFMLCSICETVMNLFRLTRMDRIFKIYPSVEEALRAIKENHSPK